MLTRRSIAQLLGIAPLVAKVQVVERFDGLPAVGPALGGAPIADATKGLVPKMPSWKAAKLLMQDPTVAAMVRAHAYQKHRVVSVLDPDIAVYKSFSMMAKVTYQRQREVERAINYETSDPSWEIFSIVKDKLNKLMGFWWDAPS